MDVLTQSDPSGIDFILGGAISGGIAALNPRLIDLIPSGSKTQDFLLESDHVVIQSKIISLEPSA
jgi:hypothetical protein